ncbi:MAG: S24 family peptidase [Lamprobacter sp.]|uniref:LexA family protein n=1 Tax=Lamprobacter sp. TaxID=3100796 RepID=UPI002B26127F|nr:S24 family peptidase [Lamprobacter sp.]MEA3642102.1 S24 family peptidase [Lamprobacter sp.]
MCEPSPQPTQKTTEGSAANGEVVVALIDGESATVKRLYREAHHLRLQPAHDRTRCRSLEP